MKAVSKEPIQDQATHKRLAQDNYFLICYPRLAQFLGSSDKALFLQRLHYWQENSKSGYFDNQGNKWSLNSYKMWQKQFPWLSAQRIGAMVRFLEDINFIETKRYYQFKQDGLGFVSRTPVTIGKHDMHKWYRLNYAQILTDTGFDLFTGKAQQSSQDAYYEHSQQEQPEPAPEANIQNQTLECSDLNNGMFKSESSIYKENHINTKKIHKEVCEKEKADRKEELYSDFSKSQEDFSKGENLIKEIPPTKQNLHQGHFAAAPQQQKWQCPGTSQERLEFIKWKAGLLLLAQKTTPAESEAHALAWINKNQEEADFLYQGWQREKVKEKENEVSQQSAPEAIPNFSSWVRSEHQKLALEFIEDGLERFTAKDSWRQYWLKHASIYLRNNLSNMPEAWKLIKEAGDKVKW